MEFTAKQIAAHLGGVVEGDENAVVNTFAKIEEGVPGALSFLSNPKYTPYIYSTRSSIVLVNTTFVAEQPIAATLIRVENAYESLAKLMMVVEQSKPRKQGISPQASIAETAKLGEGVYVAPFAVIGEGATIGEGTQILSHAVVGDGAKVGSNSVIHPNVTIYADCIVGNNCIIHAGCVIGADGFGFAPTAEGYEKIPQIGIAVIEDDVEIGANTCIDRSTMGATIVHRGAKLDNLIQVAHNVEVGSLTVMASQVGVAGSTKIGEWCMIGGQVGFAGHIKVGDRTNIGAQSGVPKSLKGNCNIMGSPSIDYKQYAKCAAAFKNLPEMYLQLGNLQREIETIKKQ